MTSKLAWVGFGGLAVSAVCITAAAMIGGQQLRELDFDFGDFDGPRCGVEAGGPAGTRAIAWNGDDRANITLPANVHYRPGAGSDMQVKGDAALLAHVIVRNGTVRLDCHGGRNAGRLEINLPGRPFRTFVVAGSGSLTLDAIDQPQLRIRVAGSGDVTANGKAGELDMKIAGSGSAKLAGLAADRVALDIAGSGDADVSPKDDLKVRIAGSGTVTLHSEPRNIDTHIAGSGRILHASSI